MTRNVTPKESGWVEIQDWPGPSEKRGPGFEKPGQKWKVMTAGNPEGDYVMAG